MGIDSQRCEWRKGVDWGRGTPLGKIETPGYSFGSSLLETVNLPLVVVMLLGFLLKLSMKSGVGLFREQLSPDDTSRTSVWAGSAKCCGEITGYRGRVGAGTATDAVLALVVWKRAIGPACWMEATGRWMAGVSPLGNRTVIYQKRSEEETAWTAA